MPSAMTFGVGKVREAVARNREAHRALFEQAVLGYRREAVKELEAMLADAREGRRVRRAVLLIEPQDMTKEYDRILRMLEMTTQDSIDLTMTEFACYVLDEWPWKEQVEALNSRYAG